MISKSMKILGIHRDGVWFVAVFLALALLFGLCYWPLAFIWGLLAAFSLYFFRFPVRTAPEGDHLLISTSDGKVVAIQEVVPPQAFGLGSEPRLKLSVFMNLFDVHVNFIPVAGTVTHIHYEQGQFLNAGHENASDLNEKNVVVIQTGTSETVGVVQVAGLIARRIRCDVATGEPVQAGQPYGLIRFGSRIDYYIPLKTRICVQIGDRVYGAQTVLAELSPALH